MADSITRAQARKRAWLVLAGLALAFRLLAGICGAPDEGVIITQEQLDKVNCWNEVQADGAIRPKCGPRKE